MTTTAQRTERVLEPAVMAFGKGQGSVTSTVLTDGERFYCGTEGCDYSHDTFGGVFSHRTTHSTKRRGDSGGLDLLALRAEAAHLVNKIDKAIATQAVKPEEIVVQPENPYKERARKAERELASVRRALARLGLTPTV